MKIFNIKMEYSMQDYFQPEYFLVRSRMQTSVRCLKFAHPYITILNRIEGAEIITFSIDRAN